MTGQARHRLGRRWLAAAALGLAAAFPAAALAAAPQIDYRLTGTRGANGWFVSPVTLEWLVTGAASTDGCDKRLVADDTAGITYTCTASASATGPTTSITTETIRVDRTPPTAVTAAAARPPDAAGVYTQPVDLTWSGTDALSGIDSCTRLTYAGPDAPAAAPTGTCSDRAGNVSAAVGFALAYDATPPTLANAAAHAAGRTAHLTWDASADAAHVTVVRERLGTHGAPRTVLDDAGTIHALDDRGLRRGATYRWTITVTDAVGNAAATAVQATVPQPWPPVLRWKAVRGADYYNIQLYRDGRKVLSAWPAQPRFRLHLIWRHHGRRHRLVRGAYRWYVWPGYGARADRRYGPRRASGRFVVR